SPANRRQSNFLLSYFLTSALRRDGERKYGEREVSLLVVLVVEREPVPGFARGGFLLGGVRVRVHRGRGLGEDVGEVFVLAEEEGAGLGVAPACVAQELVDCAREAGWSAPELT